MQEIRTYAKFLAQQHFLAISGDKFVPVRTVIHKVMAQVARLLYFSSIYQADLAEGTLVALPQPTHVV
jgi:hypothetical protein